MRRTRLLAGAILAAGLVTATLALAQSHAPRSRPSKAPKPVPSATAESPYDDKAAPAPSPAPSASPAPPPPPATSGETGPVPPPASDTADGGGRLSPLNPAANEFADAGAAPPSVDYDRLLADIGSLRARVAAVSDTLFHSKIAIALTTSGDHGRIVSLAVSIDDGVVWTSPSTFRAEDATVVYEHAVAPGHHAVSVEIERRDDRNDSFRSTQRSRFVVDVPADQRLAVEVKLWDDSNMGSDFPTDKAGQYELRVRARAKAQPIPR